VVLTTPSTANTNPEDGHTFDVVFTEDFCNGLKSGDTIVVYYNATLNDNAVVKEAENNKAYLEYKDNNDETHTTTPDETKTYTWELPVLKYANGDTNDALAGAKFSLYTDESCTTAVKFHEVKKDGETTVYRVDKRVDKEGTVTEITTDATGKFKIEGLDAGTYYLKETEAPAGYNKLDTVVKVVIDHNGKINATEDQPAGATQIEVENKSGSELPETGGMGTTIFYVLGSILVLGAAVLLITKKRMNAAA
jgi:LPXTG-motif cell wall-anchored protein